MEEVVILMIICALFAGFGIILALGEKEESGYSEKIHRGYK